MENLMGLDCRLIAGKGMNIQFSIFSSGCKQSKSLHILRRKNKQTILNGKI